MTQTAPDPAAIGSPDPVRRSRWPIYGAAAGALGIVATVLADDRGRGDRVTLADPALFDRLDPTLFRVSAVTGYLAVVLLLVLAAVWRRRVEPRVPESTAARVVPGGLVAAAGGLTLGYGWKGALALYLPGGLNESAFDPTGLYVYLLLNDFGSFLGWLGVVVAAGGVAWMALRERTISRWIGAVSLLPVIVVTGYTVVLSVPGFQGLVGPAWLVIAFLGLAFGRSTISR